MTDFLSLFLTVLSMGVGGFMLVFGYIEAMHFTATGYPDKYGEACITASIGAVIVSIVIGINL